MNTTRWTLAGIVLASLFGIAAALVTQHVYGMQPCPWCVLQRAVLAAMAVAALLALLLPGWPKKLAIMMLVALAIGGAAAALWQHFVAAASSSCNLTLADRIMAGLGLDAAWPAVFMATASCADAKVNLFGLPYEAWSLALFVLLGLAGLRLLRPAPRRRMFSR